MLKIEPTSAKLVEEGLDDWLEEVEERITDTFRGLGVALFNYVVFETPQWSGSAASNWNLRYGYPSQEVDYDLKVSGASERGALSSGRNAPRMKFGSPVTQKGDQRAVTVAVSRNGEKPSTVTGFGLDIFITNSSKSLSGESYIGMLESNPNNYLRAVNEPGHMMVRGIAKATAMFSLLSPSREAQLKKLKLGDPSNAGLR